MVFMHLKIDSGTKPWTIQVKGFKVTEKRTEAIIQIPKVKARTMTMKRKKTNKNNQGMQLMTTRINPERQAVFRQALSMGGS